jgi:ankyrin repeat protein
MTDVKHEYDKLVNEIKQKNDHLAESLITPDTAAYIDPETGNTALIWACYKYMDFIAMELIYTGVSHPGHINNNSNTALILACDNKLSIIASMLISTEESNPEHVNKNGNTALILACKNKMKNISLALIGTGQSNPGHFNKYGNTALIWACHNSMSKVALALIATGESNPGKINNYNKTALIWACKNNMSKVALALITTGESRPELVTNPDDIKFLEPFLKKYSMTSFIYTAKNKGIEIPDWDLNDMYQHISQYQNAGKPPLTKKRRFKKQGKKTTKNQ